MQSIIFFEFLFTSRTQSPVKQIEAANFIIEGIIITFVFEENCYIIYSSMHTSIDWLLTILYILVLEQQGKFF